MGGRRGQADGDPPGGPRRARADVPDGRPPVDRCRGPPVVAGSDPVTAPKRIQMSRQHPWRADNPDAVIVARPSRWGNPFRPVRTSWTMRHGRLVEETWVVLDNNGVDYPAWEPGSRLSAVPV